MEQLKAQDDMRRMGESVIRELEVDNGILASAKEEIFGCIFGRDSIITALHLLSVYRKNQDAYYLLLVRKILVNLLALQGKEWNVESGEEPGKCIHEYRPDNHAHLTERSDKPWYVYRDGSMRNYDTVDATPLFLVAIYEYMLVSDDEEFMASALHGVDAALNWLSEYADTDGDGFIDYRLHPERTHGGLSTQSWMDSADSVFHEGGEPTPYPIAPSEAQAYTYAAFRAWGSYFLGMDPGRSLALIECAQALKRLFNARFVFQDAGAISLAFAIDGAGRPMRSARSSIGHVLWASYRETDGRYDSILDDVHIPSVRDRLMREDLFEAGAGIRTLSKNSVRFDANSYHNGSIWPHDTAIVALGLERFGYAEEARQIREALMRAYRHFQTPIELFVYDSELREYLSENGGACRKQAWSAAALLDITLAA